MLAHGLPLAAALMVWDQPLVRRLMLPWLVLALLQTTMGGRFYGHYFILIEVPLCLAAALALPALSGGARRLAPAALALPPIIFAIVHAIQGLTGDVAYSDPVYRRIAEAVIERSPQGGPVFVWGYSSQIYYFARRPPASRFVYPQTLAGYVPGTSTNRDPRDDSSRFVVAADRQAVLADLAQRPPAVIVDTSPMGRRAPACDLELCAFAKFAPETFPELAALLARDYRREVVPVVADGQATEVALFIRR
jgi:hypothetical protein